MGTLELVRQLTFSRLRPMKFALLLFLVAFAARVAALLAMRNVHQFHGMQAGADAFEFDQLGLHLAARLGYCVKVGHLTAFRAPGWPLFLALLYFISYANYPLVYLTLCAMGAITCVLIYRAARHVVAESDARIGAWVAAFYLPHVYLSTLFLSETLFILLLSAFLLLLFSYLREPAWSKMSFAGVVLGYAVLTRPFALLLLPIISGYLLWSRRKQFASTALALVPLCLACAAPGAPWTVRNYQVFHKAIWGTTNGGSTFYGANNDLVLYDGRFLGAWVPTPLLPHRDWVVAAPNEVEHDQREYQLGEAWVKDHLSAMPLLEYFKFARLIAPDMLSGNPKSSLMQAVAYLPVLVLMVFGWRECARPRRRTPYWGLVHCLTLATVVSALIFYGSDRFRDATLPALILYAALGAAVLRQRFSTSIVLPLELEPALRQAVSSSPLCENGDVSSQ